MSISKQQASRTAQILFPEVWKENPFEAVARAVEFMHEAVREAPSLNNNDSPHAAEAPQKSSPIIETLRQHMKKGHLHVNVCARAIGVSNYTVRTWLEGRYAPNEANTKKISAFLEKFESTPELLTPD